MLSKLTFLLVLFKYRCSILLWQFFLSSQLVGHRIHWQNFGKLPNFIEVFCSLFYSVSLEYLSSNYYVVLLKIHFICTKILSIPCPFTHLIIESENYSALTSCLMCRLFIFQKVQTQCSYQTQSKIFSCNFNKTQPFSLYFELLVPWRQLSIVFTVMLLLKLLHLLFHIVILCYKRVISIKYCSSCNNAGFCLFFFFKIKGGLGI